MDLPKTRFAAKHANIITRWEYSYKKATTGYTYFGRCSSDGCANEISLYKFNKRQKGNLKCRMCSWVKGHIAGVPVYAARVWERRAEVLEMRFEEGRWFPYIACKSKGCQEPVKMRHKAYKRNGQPNAGLCRKHLNKAKSLRYLKPLYNTLLRSAKKRGLKVTIGYAGFVRLCEKMTCHYCDAPIDRPTEGELKQQGMHASFIDRVDPRKGYLRNNCVPCCTACNYAKTSYLTGMEMEVVGLLRKGDKKGLHSLIEQFAFEENAHIAKALFDAIWKRKSRKIKTPWLLAAAKRWKENKAKLAAKRKAAIARQA